MKRKWRNVNVPGWLGTVASQMGVIQEALDPEPMKKLFVSHIVKCNEPILTGMVIGHWIVGPTAMTKIRNSAKRVHLCVSRCGVIAGYEPYEIGGGRLPATCYGCRSGEHAPPVARVLSEFDVSRIQGFWERQLMATAFEEKSQLNTSDGHELWHRDGRVVMQEIVNRTRFGHAFGWKVFVHRFQDMRPVRPKAHRVKVQAVYRTERRIELFVQRSGSGAGFTVSLSTGRTDEKFNTVVEEVEKAIKILQSLDDGSNVTEEPPPAPAKKIITSAAAAAPESNGHLDTGAINMAKLVRLHNNIEKLMTVGKDMNELVELKTAARKKVEAANARKGDLHVAKVEADQKLAAAVTKKSATKERVQVCETSLRNAIAAADNAESEWKAATESARFAEGEYEPARGDMEAAEKELAELEQIEAERLKSVGDAKGLAQLLEALSNIG